MTVDRKRKREIRARMALTGEPYSEASRAIDRARERDAYPTGTPPGHEQDEQKG